MPRSLKRLIIAFAVFSTGLVLTGFIGLRVLASNVMKRDTEPVRDQLVADWAKHADTLDTQLAAITSWSTPSAPTPPELGCQLRWTGESAPVQRHLERCQDAPGPIDEQTLGALEKLGDQLLVKQAEAPTLARDFGWMAQLHGHDDWSQVAGTPLEFFPPESPIIDAPVLALRQVRGLALLRLLDGQRQDTLDAAVADVIALARALLGRPFLLDQLVGVGILDRTRAVLAAAGQQDLGPSEKTVEALRGARLASALLWHPWVPRAQRERFLGKLAAPSRCAAAGEALVLLEVGEPLQENYPEFVADFMAWREQKPCSSDFVNQALDLRASMPEGSWKKLLQSEFAVQAQQGAFFPALLMKIVEGTALGRHAATEVIFSVMLARPFPPAPKKRP